MIIWINYTIYLYVYIDINDTNEMIKTSKDITEKIT